MSAGFAKNTALNFINVIVGAVVSVITIVFLARILGPQKMGDYSYVMWVLATAALIVNLGLPTAVSKYVAEYLGRNEEENAKAIIKITILFELLFSIVIGIGLFFLIPFLSNNSIIQFYLKIIIFVIPFTAFIGIINAVLQGYHNFKEILKINIFVMSISLILIVGVLLISPGILNLILVGLFTNFLNVVVLGWFLRRKGSFKKLKLGKEAKSRFIKYALSLTVIILIDVVVWQRSEVFFLNRYSTAVQIAFYSVMFSLTSRVMTIIPTALSGVLMPTVSRAYGEKNQKKIKEIFYKVLKYIAFIIIPLSIGGIVLAGPIIKFVFGQEYLGATLVLQILFVSSAFGALGAIPSSVLYGTEGQNFILKLGLVVMFINLGLDFLIIPKFGATGAAIANASAQILAVIAGIIYMLYRKKFKFPFFDFGKIFLSSVIMGLIILFLAKFLNQVYGLIFLILIGTAIYLIIILRMKFILKSDFLFLKESFSNNRFLSFVFNKMEKWV
jgi:O-antigen/teichoic acid export membrane protein